MNKKRVKWVHPLKGRTIMQALEDALEEDMTIARARAKVFGGSRFIQISSNKSFVQEGAVSWTADWTGVQAHSWNTMRDCLKYGFEMSEVNYNQFDISAISSDWAEKEKKENEKG